MPRCLNRRLNRWLNIAAALLCWALAGSALAQSTVEVIPLKYRKAEQVIPVLQPLLGRDASVTSIQNQLVIRATPAELAEVKAVLARIDTPPRRLLITVRQDADQLRERQEGEISGSVGNAQGRVTVPGSGARSGGNVVLRDGDDRLRARAIDRRQSSADRSAQTIQVLEGYSAYIRMGESRPVQTRQVVRSVINGQVVERVIDSTEYHEASTGFNVLPRLQGERVTLEISPRRDSFSDQHRGGVNVQHVVTTVSGRLGDWIDLGGINDTRSREDTGLLGRSSSRVDERRGVQVKVEELP